MELRDARFVHVQTVGDLLHGQLLLIVKHDDSTLTLAQVGERAAQELALLAAITQLEGVRPVVSEKRRVGAGLFRGRTRGNGPRPEVERQTPHLVQGAVPLRQAQAQRRGNLLVGYRAGSGSI